MKQERKVGRQSRERILSLSVLIILPTIYLSMGGRTQTINTSMESCDKNPVRTLSKNDGNPYNNQYVYACLKVEDIYTDNSTEKVLRRSCGYESTAYYNRQNRRWESAITHQKGCTESKNIMPVSGISAPNDWHPPLKMHYK